MKFFCLDLHVSVIADIKRIFTDLGHTVDDWCLSNHSWVMGRRKDDVPMLTKGDWREGFIQKEPWDEFFDTYKDQLDQYDGFICCYPPVFSLLYQKFNKPIIIQIPIRYEYPFHDDAESWEYFNNYLRNGVDNKKIFLTANSVYDQKYTEAFLDRPVRYIPSLCEYTKTKYQPIRNTWLYYSSTGLRELPEPQFFWKSMLPQGYPWQLVAEFKGVLHFPYNCSTMSIFEQYMMGIPMMFPSLDFLMKLYEQRFPILEQLTWCGTFKKRPGSRISFSSPYDPNAFYNMVAIKHWMQYADFYHKDALSEVTYFDNIQELFRKSGEKIDGMKRAAHNVQRKQMVYESWKGLLSEI